MCFWRYNFVVTYSVLFLLSPFQETIQSSTAKKARRKRYREKKKIIHRRGTEAWEEICVQKMKPRWQDTTKKIDCMRKEEREERAIQKREKRKNLRNIQRNLEKARAETEFSSDFSATKKIQLSTI